MSMPYHMTKASNPPEQQPPFFNRAKDDLINTEDTMKYPTKINGNKKVESFSTQDFSTMDPWPNLPTQFIMRAESFNEGKSVRIRVPAAFVGHRLSLHGTNYTRSLLLEGNSLSGFLVEKCADVNGEGLTGAITLDSSIFTGLRILDNPHIRSKHSTRRQGSRVHLGTLIEYLSDIYKPAGLRETDTARTAPTAFAPTPVVMNTIKVEDEIKTFKKSLDAVNASAKKNGLTLFVKEDGSIGAKLEF